ncbi:MAG: B12-binding domain-containing radical SAM protein [Clostridiales bacterium]|nr:B12-binding domain-containing radical SAM protein [Candidatus Blautia equi]
MKIILAACNAKYIHSNLAIYDLKAYAGDLGQYVEIREYTINQEKDQILGDLYKSGADVICFSAYIWNITFIRELLADLIKILPDTKFWVGGPEVSYDAEQFLKANLHVTGVMVGEGEETFRELLEYYVNGVRELKDIPGIAYRDGDAIRHNGWRDTMDLSRIPFIYQDLEQFENRIIYYESSRGCPFSCSYCLSSIDKKLRFRSLELVLPELQFFLDHRVPQVKFVDRTFNCKHSHAMAIWSYIKEHDNGITNFHFEISADLLREEELELIRTMRPGLIQLEIGVQSTNPDTIKAIHRTMDFEELSKIVQRINSFGNIHQHLDLIAGLPYEDRARFRQSYNDVYALRPEQLQLGFLKVLKGSYMHEMAETYGIVYKAKEPYEVLKTNWISYEDVLELKKLESMTEVYYNSGQFGTTLQYLETLFPDPVSLYEALGDFYEKKGYSEISHARIRKYEILLEFAEEYPAIDRQELADRMLYDLYLRENLKSRPKFAADQKPYERAVWEYRRLNNIPKTAHIEVFSGGRTVLFDYTERNSLNHNARTELLPEGWMEEYSKDKNQKIQEEKRNEHV